MKPLSNKFNVLLLVIAIGLLLYFLIDLATILSGVAIITGPIYPLYLTIGFLVFIIASLVLLIVLRAKSEIMMGKVKGI